MLCAVAAVAVAPVQLVTVWRCASRGGQDKFMMHDEAVQCMTVSRDSELLATGARNGKIKVWRVATGKCVRKFLRAHEQGVSSVQFNSESNQVLSSSVDTTARCVAHRPFGMRRGAHTARTESRTVVPPLMFVRCVAPVPGLCAGYTASPPARR